MDQDVRKCVFDALSVFGEHSRTALLSELTNHGVSLDSEDFDAERFCSVLEGLLGHWADAIFIKMTADLCSQTGKSLKDLDLEGRAKILDHSRLFKEVFAKMQVN